MVRKVNLELSCRHCSSQQGLWVRSHQCMLQMTT